MKPFLATMAALSVASSAVFALSGAPSGASAAPAAPGKRAAPHRHAVSESPPEPDAVAMAEASPNCGDDPACADRARRLAEATLCAQKGGMLSDGECLVASPPPAEPQAPRPGAAASLGAVLGGFLAGPVPGKVAAALLSQPAVQDGLWRAACGLVHHCADVPAKADEEPEQKPKE